MSGFFKRLSKKLRRSTRSSESKTTLGLQSDTLDESWTDHEISDQIAQDKNVAHVVDASDLHSSNVQTSKLRVAKPDSDTSIIQQTIEPPSSRDPFLEADLVSASDFAFDSINESGDTADEITRNIQADLIAEKNRLISAERKYKEQKIKETTAEFDRPDFTGRLKK